MLPSGSGRGGISSALDVGGDSFVESKSITQISSGSL